jgi:hypothetical protein
MTLYRVRAAENRQYSWDEERETPYVPNETITDPEGNLRHVTALIGTRATAALGVWDPDA